MDTGKLWLYAAMALAVVAAFYAVLVAEPMPDNHINIVHLIAKH